MTSSPWQCSGRSVRSRREAGGSALVITLAFLVLIVSLAVIFLTIVGDETSVSSSYAQGLVQQRLNESALSLAMAQINYGTRGKDATTGGDLSWASQPGAIRTFTAAGAEGQVYKLYSAANMVTSASNFWSTDVPAEKTASAATSPALYTDLNAPILSLDPNGTIPVNGQTYSANYPIFDPTALGSVAGLSYNGSTTPPTASANPVTTGNTAPMAVRWLYMLQDGTLLNPDASGTTTASFTNSTVKPTANNPIVGRVAFWTDDETCKINLNTASEGTFWDTPRFEGITERRLAYYQPFNNEFQRFPGHPATVSLSSMFISPSTLFTAAPVTMANAFRFTPRVGDKGAANGGGSQGATVAVPISTPTAATTPVPINLNQDRLFSTVDEAIFAQPTATSTSRTADLLGLTNAQLRKVSFLLTAHNNSPETTLFDTPRISMWPIHDDLVNNINSPYQNIAKPAYSSLYTTVYDRLCAFCSTVTAKSPAGVTGLYPYFFQRHDSTSSTELNIARNSTLYQYLQRLTNKNIPGYGGSLSNKFGANRDQILMEMFDYIRCTNLFDDNLGGAGTAPSYSTTTTNYGFTPGRSSQTSFQLGHGQVTPSFISGTNVRGFGRIETISQVALHVICTADGSNPNYVNYLNFTQTPPADVEHTENPQMFNYMRKLAATFQKDTTRGLSGPTAPTSKSPLKPTERIYQMAIYLQPFSPSNNWDGMEPNLSYEITGQSGLTVLNAEAVADTITPANPPLSSNNPFPEVITLNGTTYNATVYTPTSTNGVYNTRPIGGSASFRVLTNNVVAPPWALNDLYYPPKDDSDTDGTHVSSHTQVGQEFLRGVGTNTNNIAKYYPYVSFPFVVDTASGGSVLSLSEVTLTITVHLGSGSNGPVVQTMTCKFPATTIPAPSLVTADMVAYSAASSLNQAFYYPAVRRQEFWGFNWRLGLSANDTGSGTTTNTNASATTPGTIGGQRIGCVIRRDGDVVRAMVPNLATTGGDLRFFAAKRTISALDFDPCPASNATSTHFMTSLSDASNTAGVPLYDDGQVYTAAGNLRRLDSNVTTYSPGQLPDIPPSKAYSDKATLYRDWDNGLAFFADGAFINKPDEGNTYSINIPQLGVPSVPYLDQTQNVNAAGLTYFSPNRIIPSPGMFGSLPSHIYPIVSGDLVVPWQTLLFRPQAGHPGMVSPPDHLWMDLFWMPVVQPYALSEPFATAGKVNMNYQIVPFTGIRRDTALRAALKFEMISAVGTDQGGLYKSGGSQGLTTLPNRNYRYSIDPDETSGSLRGFEAKFNSGTVFRSATQICDIYLVPGMPPATFTQTPPTGAPFLSDGNAETFWANNRLTGDNSRERPYTNLYGKLTTRSNTFTVHTRVQVLKKPPGSAPETWTENKDVVLSEYRGSTLIERYVDPSAPLVDFADIANASAKLSDYTKIRVVNSRRFEP